MAGFAYVFPGQGSQAVGMGQALAAAYPEARAVFEEVDAALGEKLSALAWEGPEAALTRTENAQPAILTASIAAYRVVAARVPNGPNAISGAGKPALVAGHSLGEYSALVAAGAIALADAVRLVRMRGRFMQEAVPEGRGAMAAVLGLEADPIRAICEAAGRGEVVSIANRNAPGQIVIAGHAGAVERAGAAAREQGGKAIPLKVSAPFHCALMKPAAERLRAELAGIAIRNPEVPVVSNVEATPVTDAERIRSLLVEQMTAPVRWDECVGVMLRAGIRTFVECGAGGVLAGLIKRIDKERRSTTVGVGDQAGVDKAVAAIAGAGAGANAAAERPSVATRGEGA